jgi:hypothetical protein
MFTDEIKGWDFRKPHHVFDEINRAQFEKATIFLRKLPAGYTTFSIHPDSAIQRVIPVPQGGGSYALSWCWIDLDLKVEVLFVAGSPDGEYVWKARWADGGVIGEKADLDDPVPPDLLAAIAAFKRIESPN